MPFSLRLAGIIAAGLVVRILFFTGLALGDDVFYQLQTTAHALSGAWPPGQTHWQTRLGMTLPTTALVTIFGVNHWSFILWPLAASTAGIWVTYRIARDFVSEPVALLAALFQAFYPLELIYSTHLFPDVLMGLFQSLSLWLWIRGLRSDKARDYVWAGVFFAIAYLCRETALIAGPAYIALWVLHGRWWRPAAAWAAVTPLVTLAGEMFLYWRTAGSPLYRFEAIARQVQDPFSVGMTLESTSGGGFWTDPLFMLAFNQEFGVYQVALVASLVYAWRRWPELRALALW